ncbi:hypothetical protein LNV09_12240 [Paucibacter sp. B2R-40]|uniref:hypothetical protein n=1 Tax=Paucibacter sp. B2R-40 TaxID=2893554 RepID=UPI0021E366E9|nr:hypothetical protein [Paucibacter sp. B2R-40]MCV2354926.1 hypothetical protein [Paucibacter sp. B2R-40]
MILEQGHKLGRAALPIAVACGVLLAGIAGTVWVTQAKASAPATKAPATPVAAAGSAPESTAALTKRYAASCESAVRERQFDKALALCSEFTQTEALAGKANSSMAVASMLRDTSDAAAMALSARHAEAAAKLNDALGKMIWAYHGLNGHGTAVAPDRAEVLLTEAQKDGVAKAEVLLASLKQSKECREHAQVALFDLPVFCMGRGELRSALTELGMREQEQSAGAEREIYALGKMLPGARQMSLQYGKQAGSQLLVPVHVTYRFGIQEAAFASQTLQRLQDSLRKKYGSPLRSESDTFGQWRSTDGVLIELKRDGAGDLLLSYRHEQRAVALQEQMLALEVRRAERLSELTLKAL